MTEKMDTGAIAFIDALGFKGIWNRYRVEEIFDKLSSMQQELREIERYMPSPGDETNKCVVLRDEFRFLSDTIAVATIMDKERSTADEARLVAYAAYRAGLVCAGLMVRACSDPAPLAYRGCIATGNFLVEENYFLGPAVDEAAQYMEMAEGSFVWFAPSAYLIARSVETNDEDSCLVDYSVPLKNGSEYSTFAINPLFVTQQSEKRAVVESILDTFDETKLGLGIKAQNTRTFLNKMLERA